MGNGEVLVFSEFPEIFKSKSGIDVSGGYKLARYLLEDIVNEASQVPDATATVVTSHEDVIRFNDSLEKYPPWNFYEAEGNTIKQLIGSLKDKYSKGAKKVIAIGGDVVASKKEINAWFNDLKKYDMLVGPTNAFSDFRHFYFQLNSPLYMVGLNEELGKNFTKYVTPEPNFGNCAYAALKAILKNHKIKIEQRKRHINSIYDLSEVVGVMPQRTKVYAKELMNSYRELYKNLHK